MDWNSNLPTRLAAAGVSAVALLAALGAPAFAQSSGTLAIEEIVVRGTPITTAGAMVQQVEPKSRASITFELISRQAPGQSVLDTINLLPAVNFTNNDAYGSSGGDLTLRGFDSQRVALLQDGVPLNDSGNYAIYPNQQLESDLISQVTVNLGTTDVDSPTAAAAGGTINYVTRRASDVFGVRAEVGYGSDNMKRFYGTVETGEIGPFGTKAWVSALYTSNDHFRPHGATVDPAGKIKKTQFNFRIDQDFGDVGQASLIGNWNSNRNAFMGRISLAQFNSQPRVIPVNTVQGAAENINPSDTGNLRMLSSWDISDEITLTVDPSYQYVLANGGGAANWAETDPQLRGNTNVAGVDLNGDGDLADTVRLYRPNNTNTNRIGVTSSLIWKFADTQSFRVAYTFDRARHRQTGEAGYIKTDGSFEPENVFAGKSAGLGGRQVPLPDGTLLRRRDRASIALLNQFAAEYRGRFMEERLLLNLGLRAPFFVRQLNQYCYQRDTFNAYCTTQVGTPVAGTDDGTGKPLVTFPVSALNPSAANRYGQPRSFDRKYDKVLPNVGASYDFNDDLTGFVSFAQTLSAPRTDDLYDRVLVDPGPEKASAYDLGLRYQSGSFMAAGAVFYNQFSNRIERVFDEANGIAFSANVGDVKLSGIDGQVGFKPVETVSFYASASYITSEIQDDIPNTGVGAPLPTKGKSLYETPKVQGGIRAQWDALEYLSLGIQGKFVGKRWTNLVNTEQFPGYSLWDLDARFSLESFGLGNTYIQGNIRNLFDKRYLADISANLVGTALAQPGYRRTYIATLHAEF
jgi:iron complex outermembrane receptor protein